jgi:hypothetical protein
MRAGRNFCEVKIIPGRSGGQYSLVKIIFSTKFGLSANTAKALKNLEKKCL